MNLRNWLFNNIIPGYLLKKMVMLRLAGKGIALMYHEVLPDDEGLAAWTVVKASVFKEQMLFLRDYFDIVTIDEALIRKANAIKFAKPFAIVTFDDGYRGNLSCVLPIAEELQLPINVFISTQATETGEVFWYDKLISLLEYHGNLVVNLSQYGLEEYRINQGRDERKNWAAMQQLLTALKTLSPQIRKKVVEGVVAQMEEAPESESLKMMNVAELRKLSESSFITIGGHSHCHNILPQLSDTDLNDSLTTNRNKLIEWTGQDISHFSYPNGDFDDRVIVAVSKAGYKTALTTKRGAWDSNSNLLLLPRYGVGRFDSFGLFVARLAQVG